MIRMLSLMAITASAVGPVTKVLDLLGKLHQQVSSEGEIETQQAKEYFSWCDAEEDTREVAIGRGADKEEAVQASLEQLAGELSSTAAALAEKHTAHDDASRSLDAARKVRGEEKKDFAAADAELSDTIDMIARAVSALRSQVSLAQLKRTEGVAAADRAVQALTALLSAARVGASAKAALTAMVQSAGEAEDAEEDNFLARRAPGSKAYDTHSKSIVQVLHDLQEEAEEEQGELRRRETDARHNFELLAQSLSDETKHLSERITQLERAQATKAEARGEAQRQLAGTQAALKSDHGYLRDLQGMCAQKRSEFKARSQARDEELATIAQADQVLRDDKAQAAFSRRIGGEKNEFVQVAAKVQHRGQRGASAHVAQAEAAKALRSAGDRLRSPALTQLAHQLSAASGADVFAKVRGMIEEMIGRLLTEVAQAASHKDWCDTESSKSKALRSKHGARVEQLTARVDKASAAVAVLTAEVSDLRGELATTARLEADATRVRSEEKKEFASLLADTKDAQDALQHAISVLRDHLGGSSVFVQLRKPRFVGAVFDGAYEKKVGGVEGIVSMLEVVSAEFARSESEARAAEEAAQRSYDKIRQDSRVSRAAKETQIKGKNSEVARLSTSLAEMKDDRAGGQQELDAVLEYIEKLNASCVVKPQSYEDKKARRESEIQALQEAMEILGA